MDWSTTALSYLASVTARSLCLVFLAFAGVALLRAGAAAARHAIWTVTVGGMLALALLAPVMPSLPIRVLNAAPPAELTRSAVEPPAISETVVAKVAGTPLPAAKSSITWQQAAVWIYFAGVAVFLFRLWMGYLLTVRLVRASRAIDNAETLYEASWISVPLTVGWLHPRILLPSGWRSWPKPKFQAVMVHERTHVARSDWAIALLARLNRCVFWFNPAAWWLERQLAALAEHACDDAALLEIGERDNYAQTLLEMAATVKCGEGRLVWEAMAMAKASEVRTRIERILDETRQIPCGLSRLRWAALVACSLPLIYVATAVQFAPVMAQSVAVAQSAGAERPDFAAMETYVAAHPADLEARGRLIRGYYLYSIKEPRLNHIFWMIQNHPESDVTGLNSVGISPGTSALNDAQDYQNAASLWRTQVSLHTGDAPVLANAARFFGRMDADPDEAERLLISARSLDPQTNSYTQQLARLYGNALIAGAPFATKARTALDASTDPTLLSQVGNILRAADRPNLQELGKQFVARAQTYGMRPAVLVPSIPSVDTPPILRKVMPEYPPAARATRIQGDMHMSIVIGTDGHVSAASVLSGHPFFRDAAIATVNQWLFSPVMQNGIPVAARTTVTIPFRLDGSDGPLVAPLNEVKPPIPQRIRVGGNVQRAKLQSSVDPVYPQAARDAGIEGNVELSIVISKEGRVAETKVIDGHPLLAAAAEQAVMSWVYSPTRLNGDPVEVVTTVTVPFKP